VQAYEVDKPAVMQDYIENVADAWVLAMAEIGEERPGDALDPLGLFEGLKRDLDRLSERLVDGAEAVLEAGRSLGAQLRKLDKALVGSPLVLRRGHGAA
jgi:hypothetical protein